MKLKLWGNGRLSLVAFRFPESLPLHELEFRPQQKWFQDFFPEASVVAFHRF